jgi:SAM-dependent methyltransferase
MTAAALAPMQYLPEDFGPIENEVELIARTLPLAGARALELGCGGADKTRALAAREPTLAIAGYEVDAAAHAANLRAPQLANVRFALGGAEAIPEPDASADLVFMFKSLHHVPGPLLDRALGEIARVLKPGGHAWISEPLFAGEYNDVMRLFHDEQAVREAAFAAIGRCVGAGRLRLAAQRFFRVRVAFRDFADFEARTIRVTHTQHRLAPETHAEVRRRFERHLGPEGAVFFQPLRVDWLRRPEAAGGD